jgi:hypothetical protein
MESIEESLPEKVAETKALNAGKRSIQYNSQDLDQEQRVDVNPFQLNTQNLHIHISNERTDYSGSITGVTTRESSGETVPNIDIALCFGTESSHPVYKTKSDQNGNYAIENIPPGYYTIHAKYRDILWYKSHFIKVLPCQRVTETILLKERTD